MTTESTAPRKHVRRSGKEIRVRVADRLEQLISGELKVEDLTDEEIRRQQLMNAQGDFRGRPPKWVPREFAVAFQQEYNRRFDLKMLQMSEEAFKAHMEILKSRHLMPGDGTRMQAVKEVYDRTRGKVVQTAETHLIVDKGKSFENYVEDALVDADVIDAVEVDPLDEIEG